MKRLMIIAFAIGALAATGCGKKSDNMGKMKGFRDQMCACPKDKDPAACAEKIAEAQDKWEEAIAKSVSESEGDKLDEVKKEMRICQRAIEGGGE